MEVWATSADGSRKLAAQPDLALDKAGTPEADPITIELTDEGPAIVGFGAAFTDASAHLIQNVLGRPERDRLLRDLFHAQGLGLSFVRVPIGASDFSAQHYSLNDVPAGQIDPDLRGFTMAPVKSAQIPVLKAAKGINPKLVIMASPWTAPGWMKTSGSLIKGRLKPEHQGAYARYFVRYLDGMAAAGVPVSYVSMQNEPDFEPADYPGMRVGPSERAEFIGQHLGPALAARRDKVGILEWDHNWDKPEQPLAVLADPDARKYISGVAWHCYGGNAEVMKRVKAAHPDKDLFFTECSGGAWAPDWGGTLGWMTDNLVIATLRAGGRGVILWNMALDEQAGPHLGGCGDCRGVVTIDRQTRAVTRNVEYYVLGQISRFARPGARVQRSTGGPAGLKSVALRNLDGTMVLLVYNSLPRELQLTAKAGTTRFRTTVPGGEVMTFVWHPI